MTSGPPAAPTVVSIELDPDSLVIELGEQVVLKAVKVMSDGRRVPVPDPFAGSTSASDRVHYVAFDQRILAYNGVTGVVVGVGLGTATVGVSLTESGLSARGTVTVTAPPVQPWSTALAIDAFAVIEFQYESNPGLFFYAPQIRVSAPTERAITVLAITLNIPGIGHSVFGCGGHIAALTARELIGEVYGDWLVTYDRPGSRATGEDVTGELTWVDETGATGSVSLRGPVVPGDLPTTYTGGSDGGACYHGYGSTGQ